VTAKLRRLLAGCGVVALPAAMAGCGGQFVRDSQSPVRLVINDIQVRDDQNTLLSDVRNTTDPCSVQAPCVENDAATVELSVQLRDIGNPASPSSPSSLNAVTITRYRVVYRRADGHNVPGVDVPYAFDSGMTFTVPATSSQSAAFQVVRHSAKEEAPLRALGPSGDIISTIAEITFYGHDQTGREVSVSGSLGIDFGDFADETD
jgi:hypothetical protein